jgi:uncharacterized membrane protein
MELYVLHTRINRTRMPIGVYGSWKLAQSEGDSHARNAHRLTSKPLVSRKGKHEMRVYTIKGQPEITYTISQFRLMTMPSSQTAFWGKRHLYEANSVSKAKPSESQKPLMILAARSLPRI